MPQRAGVKRQRGCDCTRDTASDRVPSVRVSGSPPDGLAPPTEEAETNKKTYGFQSFIGRFRPAEYVGGLGRSDAGRFHGEARCRAEGVGRPDSGRGDLLVGVPRRHRIGRGDPPRSGGFAAERNGGGAGRRNFGRADGGRIRCGPRARPRLITHQRRLRCPLPAADGTGNTTITWATRSSS